MVNQVNFMRFNVQHGARAEQWEIIYLEVRDGETLYLLCLDEAGREHVVRLPVNYMQIVQKNDDPTGSFHSVLAHYKTQQRLLVEQEQARRVEDQARLTPLQGAAVIPGPQVQLNLGSLGADSERRLIDWLTGSLEQKNLSTSPSQETQESEAQDGEDSDHWG